MARKFSKRSLDNLKGVHPKLVAVVTRALEIGPIDFVVIEGLRTVERQRELFAKKASKTMNSKHLKQADGYGHAVDLYPNTPRGWDDLPSFRAQATAMFEAAKELGIELRWGGDFNRDGWDKGNDGWDKPHFEIYKL